jgi:hypothetical protein
MRSDKHFFLFLEYFMATVIVACLIADFVYFFKYQYFPQPFFYDVGDTWMDWFNPAYWSHVSGTYDSYKTIYPPLTYVILKAITWGPCYPNAQGGWSRDCDKLGIIALHLTYVVCIALTARTLLKVDRRTALPRSLAIALGLPMLWALDRGNVILITYIFVLCAYGPLIRNAWLRCIFAGLAVNMKVYLIGPIVAQFLHRRWRWAEWAIMSTIIVYLVTFAIFGSGIPFEVINNITEYADGLTIDNPLDIWMASSLRPLLQLSNSRVFPTGLILGSNKVDIIRAVVPVSIAIGQAMVMLAAIACYVRPEAIPRSRMVLLSISIALFSTEVSGYTEILVLLFLFFENAKGFLRRFAILMGYILCIPYDINLDTVPQLVKDTFFFQTSVIVQYHIQLGPFVRPFLSLSIPIALSLLTVIEVYRDIRSDGWSNRWWFRRDIPLTPRAIRPRPPAPELP